MPLPPDAPHITYRVIHAGSSGSINNKAIHAGYSTCSGLGNDSIIHPYRFNYHMDMENREAKTCYLSSTNVLL
jgi:hypothetical protein